MAASGIQEHNEARRKERVLLRKAYFTKKLLQVGQPEVENANKVHELAVPIQRASTFVHQRSTSYEEELTSRRVGSPPGIQTLHRDTVDRYRRAQLQEDLRGQYSAKIPHRYSNFDYTSQW